jgi:hypothetical protein
MYGGIKKENVQKFYQQPTGGHLEMNRTFENKIVHFLARYEKEVEYYVHTTL